MTEPQPPERFIVCKSGQKLPWMPRIEPKPVEKPSVTRHTRTKIALAWAAIRHEAREMFRPYDERDDY